MARRVALARAVALDPMLILYDEPFAGLDPISLGIIGQLIRRLNDALGASSVMVTHDVHESLAIVDYIYFVSDGRIVAQGTPDEIRASRDPFVHQFVHAEADGPVPFHYPAGADRAPARRGGRMNAIAVRAAPHRRDDHRWHLAPRLRQPLLPRGADELRPVAAPHPSHHPRALFQRRAVAAHHHGLGALRRPCARPAGLRHPAALRLGDAVGVMVALSLLRELGPVVAALLFASRAGSALTAEIGLMKTTEQLKAMDMMAVNPIARVVAPRFWGGVMSMPLLAALFSAMGVFGGWFIGVVLIGVDDGAFWSQMQASVDFRYDIVNGIIKSVVFGICSVVDRCLRRL
jgi:hypothetical protein